MKGTIAIFLPSFASGGAERVQINLVAKFIQNGWAVTFVVQKKTGALLQDLPGGVTIFSLEANSTLAALIPLSHYLKSNQPDILLSSLGHNNIIAVWAIALARSQTHLVVCQHSILSKECERGASWRYRILPFLSRLFLPKADSIVAISKGVADDLAHTAGINRERISVIYNPVITNYFQSQSKVVLNHPWLIKKTLPVIIAVGRLAPVKDLHNLITAFAIVQKSLPCRLLIIGEGELLEALKQHALSKGVLKNIEFTGFVRNTLPYMRLADALVMSSLYEGFGNVLVEAMACGTPVISTDCPHGPAEILENGKYGTLVPVGDSPAMANAIITTLTIPPDTNQSRQHALQYSSEQSAKGYMALFTELKNA